jgi:hypothetical protein
MRMGRVSLFLLLAAALALVGAAPQRMFAERGVAGARTRARSARWPAGQQNSFCNFGFDSSAVESSEIAS